MLLCGGGVFACFVLYSANTLPNHGDRLLLITVRACCSCQNLYMHLSNVNVLSLTQRRYLYTIFVTGTACDDSNSILFSRRWIHIFFPIANLHNGLHFSIPDYLRAERIVHLDTHVGRACYNGIAARAGIVHQSSFILMLFDHRCQLSLWGRGLCDHIGLGSQLDY
jgi:hypothetical protein